MPANVRLHANADGLLVAVSTNADAEDEFLAVMTDEIRLELKRQLLAAVPDIEARTVAGIVDIYAINLGRALPHIIEIACRLRGYRSSVIEHRVMIAGAVVPDDLVGLFPNELMAIDRT